MSEPLVSIISTAYNVSPYIDTAIRSVLKQTYGNWELIVVEDGSKDSTLTAIEKYVKIDRRIRLIRHKKNWGIRKCNETHNQALASARGKYIAILDGDDYWPKEKLAIQLASFRDPETVFSFGDCIFVTQSGQPFNIVSYHQKSSYLRNTPIGSALNLFADLSFYIVPVTAMIKKSALLKIGGFRKDSRFFFIDVPTFLALSLQGKFHYQKKIVGYYRKHSGSHWFNMSEKTAAMGRTELQHCYLNFIKTNRTAISRLGIALHIDRIRQSQNKYIRTKNLNKSRTALLHYFVFNDRKRIVDCFIESVKKGGSIANTLLSLLLLLCLPVRTILLKTVYQAKALKYHVRNIFYYSKEFSK